MHARAPRVSTAVVLTRGPAARPEVFLARRNPRLRFFGGFWAFPGGSVEEVDHAPGAGPDDDATHLRCAARELFEEAGVLLGDVGARLAPDARTALRDALLADAAHDRWAALAAAHPDVHAGLRPFGRLTTPAFAPLRFRTRFVHVAQPAHEQPAVCGGELVDGRFAAPEAWLEEWRAGELLIAPPVVFLLELFAGRDVDTFLARAEAECEVSESGDVHAILNVPGVRMAPFETDTIPPATTTNAYLVGTRRLYVVDPAPTDAGEVARLERWLERAVLEAGQRDALAGVLVTHHHPDHVGAVAHVARRFGVPVLAHPRTLERLPERPADARPLHEGDVLDLGRSPDGRDGWHLVAHHTPGHDQGHLIFVESRYRAALVGDLVSTLSTIVIDPPEGHMATYLASLARARDLDLGVVHPAHGPVHRDARALFGALLEHRAAREAKLCAALAEGASAERDLLARVYDDVADPRLLGVAGRSLAAGLEKLAEEGRARRTDAGWIAAG